jgi:hypothetical protein
MQATIPSGTGSNPRITAGDTRRTYCAFSNASRHDVLATVVTLAVLTPVLAADDVERQAAHGHLPPTTVRAPVVLYLSDDIDVISEPEHSEPKSDLLRHSTKAFAGFLPSALLRR